MKLVSIGFNYDIDEINNILEDKISEINDKLDIDKSIKRIGNTNFIEYEINSTNELDLDKTINVFKHYIANAITDIIINLYQSKYLMKTSKKMINYLNNYEIEEIINKAKQKLDTKELIEIDDISYKISKKTRILKVVLEYLDSNNDIIIEGFINFRLKFYTNMIRKVIDKVLEDFIIEKEYKEFIKILQYFVEIQEPKINLVNVIMLEDNKYKLYDDKNKEINNDFFEEIANEMSEHEMNYDDLLISSLITIAPRKIIVYADDENRDVIKIIKNVFTGKVQVKCKKETGFHEFKIENLIKGGK